MNCVTKYRLYTFVHVLSVQCYCCYLLSTNKQAHSDQNLYIKHSLNSFIFLRVHAPVVLFCHSPHQSSSALEVFLKWYALYKFTFYLLTYFLTYLIVKQCFVTEGVQWRGRRCDTSTPRPDWTIEHLWLGSCREVVQANIQSHGTLWSRTFWKLCSRNAVRSLIVEARGDVYNMYLVHLVVTCVFLLWSVLYCSVCTGYMLWPSG